ncbi:hypothetical protein [Sabulicella rubraurantiaca]|uniref:hypothetical protein n=1 Tax=Sabulicella rubraurantiaca TaxID=2811429 RepID=UPI001A96ADBB|nr:hypothetical protein [Sabulicella rubraurantiaca]
MFLWPLAIDVVTEIIRGRPLRLVGGVLALYLAWKAAALLATRSAGANRRGAALVGVAAGLTAGLAAGMGPLISVALGFGAWAGTRLLTEDLPEEAPVVPPAPPPAPEVDPLAPQRVQLQRIADAAPALPHAAEMEGAVSALRDVLDELALRPARLPDARRHLNLQLDGLSRIVDRLEAGATPPETLPALLGEIAASARRLRAELNSAESEALDIQVKVLAERLRQEGP